MLAPLLVEPGLLLRLPVENTSRSAGEGGALQGRRGGIGQQPIRQFAPIEGETGDRDVRWVKWNSYQLDPIHRGASAPRWPIGRYDLPLCQINHLGVGEFSGFENSQVKSRVGFHLPTINGMGSRRLPLTHHIGPQAPVEIVEFQRNKFRIGQRVGNHSRA